MYNTPYNRMIESKIGKNVRKHLANRDMIGQGENYDDLTHNCQHCGKPYYGGKINIKNAFKTVGKAFKPVAHQLIQNGATIAGTAAGSYFGDPALGAVAGNALGNLANSQYDKAVGGAMKKYRKGSKSKTHPHELDFTTKKTSKVHHIGGHDIYHIGIPYDGITGAGVHKKKSSTKKSSPWINFLKEYSHHHGIKYSQALSDPNARTAYHNSKK